MEIKQIKGILGHECKHAGQHGAYTDSTYEYDITTEDGKEIPDEELLPYCFSLVGREKIQSQEEWRENHGNPSSYFSGYYTLTKTLTGYFFKFVSPYTD
jgi:hypothetical protein